MFVGGQIGEWLARCVCGGGDDGSRGVRGGRRAGRCPCWRPQILCLTYYPVSLLDMLGRPFRDRATARRCRVSQRRPTVWSALGCGTAQQWFDLCAMTGHDEWIDEESQLSITEQANIHAKEIYDWVRDNTVDEILDLSTAFRIPNAPVGNGANITSFDQFAERGAFVDQSARRVHPARSSLPRHARHSARAPRRCSAPRRAHRGATAETGSPATRRKRRRLSFERSARPRHDELLGRPVVHARTGATRRRGHPCGVDVTPRRHAVDRRRTDHRGAVVGASPIFSGLNTDKKSVTLDIRNPRGVELLHELVKTCDVIVENYTPRVLDQIGLDFDTVHAAASRRDHDAHARLRARRPVAGQARIRLRHRGRLRDHLADRSSGSESRWSHMPSATRTQACTASTR